MKTSFIFVALGSNFVMGRTQNRNYSEPPWLSSVVDIFWVFHGNEVHGSGQPALCRAEVLVSSAECTQPDWGGTLGIGTYIEHGSCGVDVRIVKGLRPLV